MESLIINRTFRIRVIAHAAIAMLIKLNTKLAHGAEALISKFWSEIANSNLELLELEP